MILIALYIFYVLTIVKEERETTGDGDGMSIGGNHMIHLLRRNLDINVMLFNNRIYGLTKGQYSPTSEFGKVTKSTPLGSLDYPFNPPALALGAGATFIARSLDIDGPLMQEMIKAAYEHHGTAFLEIYQNCLIFNDNAFESLTAKETKEDHRLILEDGEPMLFGANRNRGLRLVGSRPEVIEINGKYSVDDVLVHDKSDKFLALMLSELTYQTEFPQPLGVIYEKEADTYEDLVYRQILHAKERRGVGDLSKLIHGPGTWKVKADSKDS